VAKKVMREEIDFEGKVLHPAQMKMDKHAMHDVHK